MLISDRFICRYKFHPMCIHAVRAFTVHNLQILRFFPGVHLVLVLLKVSDMILARPLDRIYGQVHD
jgi:surface polysaccharide O-acyltransferase-like enzyme